MINSADMAAFMDELESLREKFVFAEPTTLTILDPETRTPVSAIYDDGAWLIDMPKP